MFINISGNYPIKFSSDDITHAMKYSMNGYAEDNDSNIVKKKFIFNKLNFF